MEPERFGRARGVGPKRREIGIQGRARNLCAMTPLLERTEGLAAQRTKR